MYSSTAGAEVNLALHRPTWQSSTHGGLPIYASSHAVDGNGHPVISSGTCILTDTSSPSYWVVDLESVYEIREVRVQNRYESESDDAFKCEYLKNSLWTFHQHVIKCIAQK